MKRSVFPPAAQSRSIYRFGDVFVDAGRREVRIAGSPAELQPKAFDLLHYLIVHRDRVVDRDELMTTLWPGLVVTEDSLTQALRRVRRVVGDDGTRQAVIRTVQRRGFRFVATLDDETETSAVDTTSAGDDVVTATTPDSEIRANPASAVTSLAVLPFLDLSPARDQRYFCDGLAEELANALGRVPGLRVAARTSAFAFRDAQVEAREIARRLDVDSLVEGSVRRADDRLRVTAKLVDSRGFQVWSQSWDRPLEDVFAIQEQIARHIVELLSPQTSGREPTRVARVQGTSLEAYDLYLRGLEMLRRFDRRSQRFAQRMFADALEIDPSYAPAWAAVATSHFLLYVYAEATEEHRRAAAEAGARAVELNPLSAEAHVGVANAAVLMGHYDDADAAFERAETLNPGLFEAWYHHARSHAMRGNHARAVELYERAALARPDDYEALNIAAQSYWSLGRKREASRAQERSVANIERVLALQPNDVRALALAPGALAALGRAEEARRYLARALTLEPEEPYVLYCATCGYAGLGEIESALDCLERMGIEKMANLRWMEHDSTLDPLRGHPRFEALRARAR